MPSEQLNHQLHQHMKNHVIRYRHVVDRKNNNNISINGKPCIDFSSNDYLSLHQHPSIQNHTVQACQSHGLGSGASAMISGYSSLHQATEKAFTQWLGVEQTILFNSGYHANIGIIRALNHRHHHILSDKLVHASLLDGITLSGAKYQRYRHNDPAHLNDLALRQSPNSIITESVFSMSGKLAPLNDIYTIAQQHQAMMLVDDAHGIGVIGRNGRGAMQHFQLEHQNNIVWILPLGKAFNAMGAIVAGPSSLIEPILQQAKSYCYTTCLPAVVCAGILSALKIIQQEPQRQEKLQNNIQHFNTYAKYKKLKVDNQCYTPIRPIIIGENQAAMQLQQQLIQRGYYTAAIRPPTVSQAQLRISLNSNHQYDQIEQLINHICVATQS